MNNEKKIVSSHIFVFPFRWDYISNENKSRFTISKRINMEKIKEALLEKWHEDKDFIKNDDEYDKDKDIHNSKYNKYYYFYDNVRQAIYGEKENGEKKVENRIVQCFKYKSVDSNSTYNIEISKEKDNNGIKETIKYSYSLRIKDIKIKIYDTGVANLVYFLENYSEKTKPEDILRINDYGRRIYPQFLPLEKCQGNFLAKKIILKLSQGKSIEERFYYGIKKYPNRISKTVMELLGDKFICNEAYMKKEKVFIRPIIDDRMFTICIYRNNFISDLLTKYDECKYLKSEFWYKYIFVDNDEATCQDDEMCKCLLKKSTYTRWKKYGTMYGISRYSLVAVTNESDFALKVLFTHMKSIYYEMVLIALTERASILKLSDEASKIATLSEDEALLNVKKLQKYYVEFINNIYFREVTAQEQGIEMYNKLVEMMEIERDVKRLGEEIDGIHKYTSMISSERTSNLLKIITYLGIGFTACNFAINVFGKNVIPIKQWKFKSDFNLWISQTIVFTMVILVLILLIFKQIIRKEQVKIAKLVFYSILSLIVILILIH